MGDGNGGVAGFLEKIAPYRKAIVGAAGAVVVLVMAIHSGTDPAAIEGDTAEFVANVEAAVAAVVAVLTGLGVFMVPNKNGEVEIAQAVATEAADNARYYEEMAAERMRRLYAVMDAETLDEAKLATGISSGGGESFRLDGDNLSDGH